MEKLLLLGAEAIAQGAIDGGMSGIYAYPGTPSTEITEYVQKSKLAKELNIHSVRLAPYSFSRAAEMLPKLDLRPLITVFPLSEVRKAFAAHKAGKDAKILLQPGA